MKRAFVLTLALVGCQTASLDNPMHATGSRTIAANADMDHIVALNVEEGTLTVAQVNGLAQDPIEVGSEPTRVARVGDRYFVTLRGEGALAVVELQGSTAVVVDRLPLGAEPFGVVASEEGELFVALAGENAVVALDSDTLVETGRWSVPDEPRWVAVGGHRRVYVGSMKNASLHQIDLDRDVVERVELPTVTRSLQDGESVELTNRITGDMSVSPDGRFLAVPILSVDNRTSGNGQSQTSDTTYGSSSPGPDRFNPGVALMGLGRNGDADNPLAVLSATTEDFSDDRFAAARSFPSAAIYSPAGDQILVPMEGSHVVSVLQLQQEAFDNGLVSPELFKMNGYSTPLAVAYATPTGPRSLAFVDQDEAVVHNWLDRSVSVMGGIDFNHGEFGSSTSMDTPIEVSHFSTSVERGRNAFNTATNSSMQAPGSGVTCATCHFDGREDGLTWSLEDGPRQTMNLGGVMSDTLPITWDGSVQQITTEVILTSGNRMGGEGADPQLAADVAAYIDITRAALPSWEIDGDAIARGEVLFNREDVGCAECHPAPTFTDGENHEVIGGRMINTPTLRGLAASGPYFHNGEAMDLDAVLSTSRIGRMGDIGMLSTDEIEDLRAYLLSL
ncbi:MAG: c-type cytochrome [Deltaproteobacteria bacterium]|nr:MAG: c-type cytochrome [Deltaproteobacteria bacterium]